MGKNCSYLETFLNLIFGGKYPISRDTWNFYTKRYSQDINENLHLWTSQELRDLQLLFNLAWIDPLYYEEYPICVV